MARFIPWLGLALTAYELYRYLHPQSEWMRAGWYFPNYQHYCGTQGEYAFASSFGPWCPPDSETMGNQTFIDLMIGTYWNPAGLNPPWIWYGNNKVQINPSSVNVTVLGSAQRVVSVTPQPWRWAYAPPMTAEVPAPLARLDPFRVPPGKPAPLPIPIPPNLVPYRPPLRDRVERPERWHPRPVTVTPPSRFEPPRPPKGEKEKKFKTKASAALFMWLAKIMNYGTEAVDFIEAIWKALPREMRSGKEISKTDVSLQQAVRDIVDHLDDIDEEIAAQMVANLIENAVEDHLVGKLEAEWAKANKRLGRRQTNRPGWQNAPGYQDLINDLWDWYSKL